MVASSHDKHQKFLRSNLSLFELPARQHDLVTDLLQAHATGLAELGRGLGSPLHVVLPQIFIENARSIQQVFTDTDLEGEVLFAKKANKADCFVRACARHGIGVDIASSGELAKALAAGVVGDSIGLSGPAKSDGLLRAAIHQRCLIAVDSVQELRRLASLASSQGNSARILLRRRPEAPEVSRFGLNTHELEEALQRCQADSFALKLEGFSFHLGGYSIEQRALCANESIDLCLQAQARGLPTCRRVDIGGGLPVQYVDPTAWRDFLRQDAREHYHAEKSFGGFYPYGVERHGAQSLRALLDYPIENAVSLAHKARRHGIGIIVEPGRALLDQAGISLFEVQDVKDRHASEGYAIVTVQGSSLSLSEQWFNSEYLPQPLLLGQGDGDQPAFVACVGGSTCLENDMLTWRKVTFSRAIKHGDWLVYLNTAGYQMDSNESSFHEADLPLKVVVQLHSGETAMRWRLDGK